MPRVDIVGMIDGDVLKLLAAHVPYEEAAVARPLVRADDGEYVLPVFR